MAACNGGVTDAESTAASGTAEPMGSLASALQGSWSLTSATCDTDAVNLYDGDPLVLTFDGDQLTAALDSIDCIVNIPANVTYDDDAGSFEAVTGGVVSCVPAGCAELCDTDASVLPAPKGAVTLSGDELTLTTTAVDGLGTFLCTQNDLTAPAVETFERGQPFHRRPFDPADIDETICDGFDPLSSERTIYYIATEEPGADNDSCDGLAPTDEGGGHCPFKDFTSLKVRELMHRSDGTEGVKGVTFAVRSGTYFIEPLQGDPNLSTDSLQLHGSGENQSETLALVAYPDEAPILDGTCPASIAGCDSPEDPGRIWMLLSLDGSRVHVQGLTFDNVHKWNIIVYSRDTCIVDNTFIGSYGSDSDSLKSGGPAPNVIVRGNDFSVGFEQALDGTAAHGWLIEDNYIHDAPDRGIGFKLGASGNIVRNNTFENLGGFAVSLGGVSSPHTLPIEATNLIAESNTASNVLGFAEVFSCGNCRASDNNVTAAGLFMTIRSAEPSGCPGAGCQPTHQLSLNGNRMRGFAGQPESPLGAIPANAYVAIGDTLPEGLSSAKNLYCLEPGNEGIFGLNDEIMNHQQWSASVMTDETSTLTAGTDPLCSGW